MLSDASNALALYSVVDSDWLSVFLSFFLINCSGSDSYDIIPLCRYCCGLDFKPLSMFDVSP